MEGEKANAIISKLQYFIGVFLFIVTVISLSSCSSNKYSQLQIEKYLTNNRVKTKSSTISFRIPQGWHAVDANNKMFIDLWFVRDDLNVSLSFLPFKSNSTSLSLQKSYELSILLQQAKFKNKIRVIKENSLKLDKLSLLFYNFKTDGKQYRVALFEIGNRIYECTLWGDSGNVKVEYFIQELVIASAKSN